MLFLTLAEQNLSTMYQKLKNRFSEITNKYVCSIPNTAKEQNDFSRLLKRHDFFSRNLSGYKNELKNASKELLKENDFENNNKLNEMIHDEVTKFKDIVLLGTEM